jgi:hypothetical protein
MSGGLRWIQWKQINVWGVLPVISRPGTINLPRSTRDGDPDGEASVSGDVFAQVSGSIELSG